MRALLAAALLLLAAATVPAEAQGPPEDSWCPLGYSEEAFLNACYWGGGPGIPLPTLGFECFFPVGNATLPVVGCFFVPVVDPDGQSLTPVGLYADFLCNLESASLPCNCAEPDPFITYVEACSGLFGGP